MGSENKRLKLILVVTTFIVVTIFVFSKFIVIKGHLNDEEIVFGIIDSQLTVNYDNVITNNENKVHFDKNTHGDRLINFANKYYSNLKIYYYDATNENGNVDTNGIIAGLEWMKKNRIKNVNISMSSSLYSDGIESYIEENQNELKIFASYHNLEQSLDYPAMYNGVIASGKRNRIVFKSNDIEYKSSNIILISKGITKYEGNSFLSIITIINDIR